jgi:hypothetical protein
LGFAAALLLMQEPTAKTTVLIAVMGFCRFYYFSARKRFAGVLEALRYLLIQNRRE